MLRRLAQLLCLLALLVQVVSGALPTGFSCIACGVDAVEPEKCCCERCGEKSHKRQSCCCPIGAMDHRDGCNKCLRVRVPERESTAAAKLLLDHAGHLPVALLPDYVVPQSFGVPARFRDFVPRADESPPNLLPISSTRLIV